MYRKDFIFENFMVAVEKFRSDNNSIPFLTIYYLPLGVRQLNLPVYMYISHSIKKWGGGEVGVGGGHFEDRYVFYTLKSYVYSLLFWT